MAFIAIVGSEEKYWTEDQKIRAKKYIFHLIQDNLDSFFISGGCPKGGVDIWAEEAAAKLGKLIAVEKPTINKWSPKGGGGYKERNIRIATNCTVLYDIEPEILYRILPRMPRRNVEWNWADRGFHRTSGGTWTMKYAKRLGKEVHLKVIKLEPEIRYKDDHLTRRLEK